MYTVNEPMHVRLPNGRSVVLRAGPRGIQLADPRSETGEIIDLDENLRRTVPADILKKLIKDGKITESE